MERYFLDYLAVFHDIIRFLHDTQPSILLEAWDYWSTGVGMGAKEKYGVSTGGNAGPAWAFGGLGVTS